MLKAIADYLLLASMVPLGLFILRYITRSPWRLLVVGRSMMYLAVSLEAVLAQGGVSLLWPDYPGRDLVRLVLYAATFVSFCKLLHTLIRVQAGQTSTVSALTSSREDHRQ